MTHNMHMKHIPARFSKRVTKEGLRKCWNASYVLHTAQYSMNNKSPGVVSESRVPLPVSRLPYEAFHASSVDHINRITCLYRSQITESQNKDNVPGLGRRLYSFCRCMQYAVAVAVAVCCLTWELHAYVLSDPLQSISLPMLLYVYIWI